MSQASSSRVCKYGAFLSFRGSDTRRNFVSHLYTALEQRGIDVFKDDERLETGKSISIELLKAIEESRSAIVIFSKSYASSRWCLEELAHIIKCRNELDQIVIPIFYDVSPSDVSHQNTPFAESFSRHEEKYKDDLDKVQRWREACKQAGKISGYHLQECKDEADCIKKVVDYILPSVISSVSENIVGTQVDNVISLLHMKSNDVCSVGIWGMSGIGKTEIASVIYERYRHQFEAYCFLGDVGEMYQKKGLTWLQKTLIRKLLGQKMTVTSERDGTIIIRNGLRWKKVLLILDNVDHPSQLELIVGGTEWFGRGSKILITTRDKHLIIAHVKEDKVYEVLLLSESEALELFCMHAFKRKSPERDFEELSSEVVKYADGLPLALKVLGSSFCRLKKDLWVDTINKLKKIPKHGILEKLRIGLDGLDKDEMRIFLDIACMYNHKPRYYVETILKSCGIHPMIEISRLIDKSLLSISRYVCGFQMHSLIRQMGQDVSRKEYANNRIWLVEEVHDLFAGKLKTKKVESLWIPHGYCLGEDHVNLSKVFKSMQSLQVLIFDYESIYDYKTIFLESTITCLPSSLRWIEWPYYPSSSLPEKFDPSHLVGLSLCRSQLVELWPIPKKLSNLKHLVLRESLGLTKTPNFGDMPNLETLNLEWCENLEEVHPSLGHCSKLTSLNLYGCLKLKKLPRFVTMESLETLYLNECTSLEEFPEICGDMRRFSELFVGSPWIRSLPPSLSGLRHLKLVDCEVLAMLPNSLFESQQLEYLHIYDCSRLVELPVSLGVQKKLRELYISKCENLNKLPSSIQMESLYKLEIFNCPKLDTFPEIKGDMHCLEKLTLNAIGIRELPSSIGNLKRLCSLILDGCGDLVSLPDNICNLMNLQRLYLCGCKKLEKLPENMKLLQHFLRTCIQCDFNQRRYFLISIPEVIIPELFDYRFINQERISINLNPSWYTDKFMGFSICYCPNKMFVLLEATLVCKSDPKGKHSLNYDIRAYDFDTPVMCYIYIPFETLWHASGNKEGKNPNDYYLFEVSNSYGTELCWGIRMEYENKDRRWRRKQRATQSPKHFPVFREDTSVTAKSGCSIVLEQPEPSSPSSSPASAEHDTATDRGLCIRYEKKSLEVDQAAMDGASRKRKRKRNRKKKRKMAGTDETSCSHCTN